MMLLVYFSGATTMGFAIAGLFFLRFWRRTGDRLFLSFAIAFWLLGAGQAALTLGNVPIEEQSPLYLLRLAAFLIIIAAVAYKNFSAR